MDLFNSLPTAGGIVPRPYQTEAVDAVFREWRTVRSTLVQLATGLGKTPLVGMVAARFLAEWPGGGGVLVLAHQRQLVTQAADELAAVLGFRPDVEMGDLYASASARVVVASVQTLASKNRLERFPADRFGLVVADEAHHYAAGVKSYVRPLAHFPRAVKLGVTATPERHDGQMLGTVWQSLAYSMGIDRAVAESWLVPIRQQFVRVNHLDLSGVRTTGGGDLDARDLSAALTRDQRLSLEIAAAVEEHCAGQPTLIFTAPRPKGEPAAQGHQVAAALNDLRPGCALYLTGETSDDDRRRHYARFARGEFDRLVGCNLSLEGFNQPTISRVVMARQTESRPLYEQMVGRGTRTLKGVIDAPGVLTAADREAAVAASPKPWLGVMDLVGNSGRHKLVTSIDLFAGTASAGARERAKATAAADGRPVPVRQLVADAVEEDRREARFRATVSTTATAVDPFAYANTPAAKPAKAQATDPATPAQLAYLKQHGVVPDRATVGSCGSAIADIQRRRKHGLASQKQERTLRKAGLWKGGDVPRAHAAALIDLLPARDWQAPGYDLTRDRLGIVTGGDGLFYLTVRDVYRFEPRRLTVGTGYRTQDEVRAAYRGLCPEPAAVA